MNAQEYRDALKKRTINKNNEANEENKGHKEPVKNAPVRQNQSAPQGEPRERMQRKPVKPVDREMAPQERMQRKPVKPVNKEATPQERMQRKPVKPVNKEAAPQERMQRKPVSVIVFVSLVCIQMVRLRSCDLSSRRGGSLRRPVCRL